MMFPLRLWASPSLSLNPGRWRITTRQQIAGAALPFMTRHRTLCLTPAHPFPGTGETACHHTLIEDKQSILSWRLHCTPAGAMPAWGQAVIHYQGKRLNGKIHLLIVGTRDLLHSAYPIRLELNAHLKGRRIGPCDGPTGRTGLG